jgi:hypothetical protein
MQDNKLQPDFTVSAMTGPDGVLDGIERAKSRGLRRVKMNSPIHCLDDQGRQPPG